jgi:hypothetical protein
MAFHFFCVCALIGESILLQKSEWALVLAFIPAFNGHFLLGELFRLLKSEVMLALNSIPIWILTFSIFPFGNALIKQGQHKREILVEHVFRVFYVIWQKRVLEHDLNLEIAQHGGDPSKKKQAKKTKP